MQWKTTLNVRELGVQGIHDGLVLELGGRRSQKPRDPARKKGRAREEVEISYGRVGRGDGDERKEVGAHDK